MAADADKEVTPKGSPHEGHAADRALHDEEALDAAAHAQHAEGVGTDESLSPKQRAKALRKLGDDELLALAEHAVQADHWLDVARRAQAELDNTVKRMRREHQDDLKFASVGLARELLPVIDNLDRALASAGKETESLAAGIRMTRKLMVDALARFGITPIEAAGRPFDPAFHEALMTTNNPDLPDNAVALELEQGWKLHDRVLRATKVQVNKKQ